LISLKGHVNFSDEVTAALRLCDGIVLFVDAVEGVMLNTERILKHAVQVIKKKFWLGFQVFLLTISFRRRKWPSQFASTKSIDSFWSSSCHLRTHITSCATLLKRSTVFWASTATKKIQSSSRPCWATSALPLPSSPFASPLNLSPNFTVTRTSIIAMTVAKKKLDSILFHFRYGSDINDNELARRLWGDIYFNSKTRKFTKKPPHSSAQRSFIEFILEPLYKIFAQACIEDDSTIDLNGRLISKCFPCSGCWRFGFQSTAVAGRAWHPLDCRGTTA
jgi:116 kDa U5 small nuclear ribonucleoprotein component